MVGPGQRSQTLICLHGEVQLEEEKAAPSPVGSGGLSSWLKVEGMWSWGSVWVRLRGQTHSIGTVWDMGIRSRT